jgi:hypothetical protein
MRTGNLMREKIQCSLSSRVTHSHRFALLGCFEVMSTYTSGIVASVRMGGKMVCTDA